MATYHVTQSGAGSANGTSEASAWSLSSYNNASNWSATPATSGKISPGDTVMMYGTFTATIGAPGSGASGNLITILFAPGAKVSVATATSPLIDVFQRDYLVFDGGATGMIGGTGGDPTGVNAIIECTDNGTLLGNQNETSGFSFRGCRHITVKGFYVRNIFIKTPGSYSSDTAARRTGGISFEDPNGRGMNDLEVYNCLIHDVSTGVSADYGPSASNYHFHHYTAYNVNWGGRVGDRNTSSVISNVVIDHCRWYNFTDWDQETDLGLHHNGFFIWAVNGGTFNDARLHNNIVGPGFTNRIGPGGGYNACTAGIFCAGPLGPIYVYNNLFINTGTHGPSNGLINFGSGATGTEYFAFNNTFIGGNGSSAIRFGDFGGTLLMTIKNNLLAGADKAWCCLYKDNVTVSSENNLIFNTPTNAFEWSVEGAGGQISLASWQSSTSQDGDILTSDPLLTETYRLGASSPAIGEGENLSAFFTTDADGNTRPASGAWDIGAYQYGEAPPPTPPAARGRKRRGAKLLSFFR
jgi:hypothetical protein